MEEAKAAAANAVFEYQSLVDMVALKQIVHDEGYKEVVEDFVYTTTTKHSD